MTELRQLERNRSLKELSTLGIGGPAKYYTEVHEIAALQEILRLCRQYRLPYLILGKGSNVLFDDRGFAGVVIANRIQFLNKIDEKIWHVGAGYSFSLLGSQTSREGLAGLEFASGIPASVGGAVYMNAGANGSDTSQTLLSVDFVTDQGELLTLAKDTLDFSYRFSSFQERKGAIVGATFKLTKSSEARQKQLNIIQYRKKTQPYGSKSAGCIFRNPSCAHAGALIEKSNLKGKKIGGAEVSTLHANFLINAEEATSSDILNLITHVKLTVKEETGFDLEHEVRYIPYNPMDGQSDE